MPAALLLELCAEIPAKLPSPDSQLYRNSRSALNLTWVSYPYAASWKRSRLSFGTIRGLTWFVASLSGITVCTVWCPMSENLFYIFVKCFSGFKQESKFSP